MLRGFEKMRCGLLGERLSHSYSPLIHSKLADYEYLLHEKSEHEVADFLKNGVFDALNVTIPYKTKVIPYLDYISDEAKKIGAVNTVIRKNGGLYGSNTDYFGFKYTVRLSGIEIRGKKALILGSGGSSFTAAAVLSDLDAREIITVSRSGAVNYSNITEHADADIIVNTTPVGMYPKNGESPVSLKLFPKLSGVIDIIFNPARTALLLEAESLGIPRAGGLPMLVAQAAEACGIFTDTETQAEAVEGIISEIENLMQNIILVGMPGSGKSTVGKILAERLGREFFDSDAIFESTYGKTPRDMITEFGEDKFRENEHNVLKDIGKKSGAVISTGGGAVTRAENYPPLHQNGRIIFIERETGLLDTTGRPLSFQNNLAELFAQRLPKYLSFADHTVKNDGTPETAAEKIIKMLGAPSIPKGMSI